MPRALAMSVAALAAFETAACRSMDLDAGGIRRVPELAVAARHL
ncbi:MAG TPA: hypothetical protein VEK11_10365 [Thermoanaerobaculia bacterium]|nr:hypothetical protein [Thermoanaerobaculia bacterium]